MEEILKLLKCRAVSCSQVGLLNIVKISFLPETTTVSVILVKISTGFFMELDEPVMKFIQECKDKAKAFLKSSTVEKLTLLDIQISNTAIVLKRV